MDNNVHLGVWVNWSRGRIMGATFTTTRQKGDLLIAFTGFLIPFVASRFWSIFCLVFHRCYSTSQPRDALYHQRQVILRNSTSPDSGLISLVMLSWAWRKLRRNYPLENGKGFSSIYPVALFAMCCISAFVVAGGFSSQISSAPGQEVLLKGNQCSIPTTTNPFNISTTTKPISEMSVLINNAANYAQQCYTPNASQVLDCDKFVAENLILPTSTIQNDSSCPFEANFCRSNDSNIRLDTGYIDSNDDLGLNAPYKQRYSWRYVLQCAPLVTEGFTSKVTIENQTFVNYNYGASLSKNLTNNFTYGIRDLDYQYFSQLRGTRAGFNFGLSYLGSKTFEGAILPSESLFIPIPSLYRPDGDLTLVFLSGNGVYFNEPMDDDWYRATTPGDNLTWAFWSSEPQNFTTYVPAEAASPLGCLEQWQWCNSDLPKEIACGPLGSLFDAIYGAAPKFNLTGADLDPVRPTSSTDTGSRYIWDVLIKLAGYGNVGNVLRGLGAKLLTSQSLLASGIQYPLPHNQWQLDVTNWWYTVLAATQIAYVETALGTTDPELRQTNWTPLNEREQALCNSQKIRSAAYTSFSFFGLLFAYITSFLIVFISYILQPIMLCLHKRRKYKDYAFLEWTTNENLQLHRLTQEELQVGTWSGCTDKVPTTKAGDLMASLDISDLEHPILALKTPMVMSESKRDECTTVVEVDHTSNTSDESNQVSQSSTDAPTSHEEGNHHTNQSMEPNSGTQPNVDVTASEERVVPCQDHQAIPTPNELMIAAPSL